MRRNRNIKIRTIPMHFMLDSDRDGVFDYLDCQPFNHWKQHKDPGDWMDTKNKKPKKEFEDVETKIYIKGLPIPITKSMISAMDEVFKDLQKEEGIEELKTIFYKNYKIKFVLYKKGHEVGSYPGHRQTDVYLQGFIYAHGFEQDPTSPYGEKKGQTIGMGKTISEASRNAKKWIDENG